MRLQLVQVYCSFSIAASCRFPPLDALLLGLWIMLYRIGANLERNVLYFAACISNFITVVALTAMLVVLCVWIMFGFDLNFFHHCSIAASVSIMQFSNYFMLFEIWICM